MKHIIKKIIAVSIFLGLIPFLTYAQFTFYPQGGVGVNTAAQGDMFYASTANPLRLSKLTVGGNGTCLTSNGTVPSWGSCAAGSVSGTGSVNTLTYWNSGTTIGATSSPTVGYITATSTTASQLPYASTTAFTLTGPLFAGANLPGTSGQYLQSIGTGVKWVASTTLSTISGLLAVTLGGTGWNNVQAGAILYGNGSSALATTSQGTGGQILSWSGTGPVWSATTTFSGALSYAGGGVTCLTASASQAGCLAALDWSTFNNKAGSTTNTFSGLQQMLANSSTTALSVYTNLFVGGSATSTIQGATTGTSSLQGYLNVTGANTSTSTFTGGVAANQFNSTGSASSTFAQGINLTAGCFSVLGICVTSTATLSGGSPNTLTYWTSGTAVSATGSPTVGYLTATSTTATSTFAGNVSIANGSTLNFGGVPALVASSSAGSGNTIFGIGAGATILYSDPTAAGGNTAIGNQACQSLQGGTGTGLNTCIGAFSLTALTTGIHNTALGNHSMRQMTTGNTNACGGYNCQDNANGSRNDSFGNSTLYNNNATDNSVLGHVGLLNNIVGANNVAIGSSVGYNYLGSSTILIGAGVDVASTTLAGQLTIGNVITGVGMYDPGNFSEGTTNNTPTAGGMIGIGTTTIGNYARLTVWGGPSDRILSVVNAASTTNLWVANSGNGTTTVTGLNISGSATSTSNVGYNITTGCFSVNNTCVGGSSISGGTAGMLASWSSASGLTATGTPTAASYVATSTTASQFPYASTTALSIGNINTTPYAYRSFTLATTTAWTGTSTPRFFTIGAGEVGSALRCATDVGTLTVRIQVNGATDVYVIATSTPGILTPSLTLTTAATTTVSAGNPATSPTQVVCTLKTYLPSISW